MAFHSYTFILVLLPACYVGFLLAHRIGGWRAAFNFLVVASLAYYAQWSVVLAAILMASVSANFICGRLILANSDRPALARAVLFTGIGANLGALGYLKYANFLIDILNQFIEQDFLHISLIVPIGVSFYTFVQIGYLIETYAGQVGKIRFGRYVLFATFFPCVTAGPLVQPREMLDQMSERTDAAFNPRTLACGLAMFAMGLFKKVALADNIGLYADATFNGVAGGLAVSSLTAWLGSICYALQLYFDFSGYSDMAVGLGCIFGLKLPLNFASPFKTTNISDFWRCWHITMTRFFTTYVYTPLAVRGMRRAIGQRSGPFAKYVHTAAVPALVTFMIAGIWHGAGWTFIVYGIIHGAAIAAYLGWSRLTSWSLPLPVGWLLTMSVVVSALVVFRAPDLAVATKVLGAMWSFGLADANSAAACVAIDLRTAGSLVVVLGAIVLLMPNTQQILYRYHVASDDVGAGAAREAGLLTWTPSFASSVAIGTVLCLALGSIGVGSGFLYYQF